MSQEIKDVVGALIFREKKFLICQRPANKARGLLWEFVGGKVEKGETKPQALIRECQEELDINVIVDDLFMEVIHQYPDILIRLSIYLCSFEGDYVLKEHNDAKWITASEIDNYQFCPADKDILAKIKERFHD